MLPYLLFNTVYVFIRLARIRVRTSVTRHVVNVFFSRIFAALLNDSDFEMTKADIVA